MKKKINYFVVFVLCIFIGVMNVKAVSITANTTTINVGKSTIITISDVVNGYTYSLDYNEDYLLAGTNTCGNRSAITSNCEITLIAKDTLSLENNTSVKVTIKEEASNDAEKSLDIIIKANKTPTTTRIPTTTTKKVEENKSSNAFLKSALFKDMDGNEIIFDPVFNKESYEYTATVASNVNKVLIEANMEDINSTLLVSNNANEELVAGAENKITITVTAQDNTKKVYTFNIKREALDNNALIDNISIKEAINFKFNSEVFNYNVKIKSSVDMLTIKVDSDAKVEIFDNTDIKEGSKVKLIATAEDGTKKEYILNISIDKNYSEVQTATSIKEEKNPLIIITLSLAAFAIVGAITYLIKKR